MREASFEEVQIARQMTEIVLGYVERNTRKFIELLKISSLQELPEHVGTQVRTSRQGEGWPLDAFMLTPPMQALFLEYWSLGAHHEIFATSVSPDAKDVCAMFTAQRAVVYALLIREMRLQGFRERRIRLFDSAKTHKIITPGWKCSLVVI